MGRGLIVTILQGTKFYYKCIVMFKISLGLHTFWYEYVELSTTITATALVYIAVTVYMYYIGVYYDLPISFIGFSQHIQLQASPAICKESN